MNSPNPAYYEAMATARGVRPTPARSWSILLTSANHGTVGPLGSTFSHAGEHHERVVVVEVPAAAGAPVDQVDLKLVSGAGAAAADAHPAPGHLAVVKLDEAIAWATQLPIPTRGASTMVSKLREAREALLVAPATAQAGQVAVPEMTDEQIVAVWQAMPGGPDGWLKQFGYLQFARALLAAAPVPCAADLLEEIAQSWDGCEYPDAMIKDIGAALRNDFARFTPAPSAPAVAQQAPMAIDGVRWDLFPGYLIDHCEGDLLSEEGLQSALAGMLKDPQYLAAVAAPAQAKPLPAQAEPIPQPGDVCTNCHCADGEDCPSYAKASTAGERQEGGA